MVVAFRDDPRTMVAFDWSAGRTHATWDGRTVSVYESIDALVDQLKEPTKMVAEATFESFDPDRRSQVLERLRSLGHELYVYRPKSTARRRPAGSVKSDEEDARVIHQLAATGQVHLYRAPTPCTEEQQFRIDANLEYNRIRLQGGKAALQAAAIDLLGPYKELPAHVRVIYGANGYCESLLAAAYFAARRARSRNEFERLLGLHESGYPSLLRSEVHHHAYRHAARRGVSWSQFRRELRRLYRLVRESVDQPVTPAPSGR